MRQVACSRSWNEPARGDFVSFNEVGSEPGCYSEPGGRHLRRIRPITETVQESRLGASTSVRWIKQVERELLDGNDRASRSDSEPPSGVDRWFSRAYALLG